MKVCLRRSKKKKHLKHIYKQRLKPSNYCDSDMEQHGRKTYTQHTKHQTHHHGNRVIHHAGASQRELIKFAFAPAKASHGPAHSLSIIALTRSHVPASLSPLQNNTTHMPISFTSAKKNFCLDGWLCWMPHLDGRAAAAVLAEETID